jgi:hypothetical protein
MKLQAKVYGRWHIQNVSYKKNYKYGYKQNETLTADANFKLDFKVNFNSLTSTFNANANLILTLYQFEIIVRRKQVMPVTDTSKQCPW